MDIIGFVADNMGHFAPFDIALLVFQVLLAALLGYLLARDLGTASVEDVDGLVDKLVERTDGIAAKYSSLWK